MLMVVEGTDPKSEHRLKPAEGSRVLTGGVEGPKREQVDKVEVERGNLDFGASSSASPVKRRMGCRRDILHTLRSFMKVILD